jgi:hypothetical protein
MSGILLAAINRVFTNNYISLITDTPHHISIVISKFIRIATVYMFSPLYLGIATYLLPHFP